MSLFDRQKIVLLATFLLMVLSLRNALYPAEQWLQHTPTVLMLLGLLWSTGNSRLSPIAFSCAISFIALHIIGARWIYSNVPYDAWWESLTGSFLSLCVVMAVGAAYEVLEWQIAMLFSPDQAEAYNGQQGDLWDAQKDLCLAGIGGLAAIGIHWIWSEMRRD